MIQLAAPSTVDMLLMKNGFWAVTSGVDQYWRNHRVKEASITFQYAGSDSFSDPIRCIFSDEKTMLSIDLGGKQNVTALRFQVESIYTGNKFDDVAVTYMDILGYPGIVQSVSSRVEEVANSTPSIHESEYIHPSWVSPSFPRGKKYSVYSGPGTHYYRAANGKASVSTNEWIHVFGFDGDWTLVEYSISESTWRRGYIERANIPSDVQLAELPNANLVARTTTTCAITDDPMNGRGTAVALDAGSEVLYLFGDGDWAYVEAWTDIGLMRGYVRMKTLSF